MYTTENNSRPSKVEIHQSTASLALPSKSISEQKSEDSYLGTCLLFVFAEKSTVYRAQAKKQAGIPSDDSLRANNISQILSNFASHMLTEKI